MRTGPDTAQFVLDQTPVTPAARPLPRRATSELLDRHWHRLGRCRRLRPKRFPRRLQLKNQADWLIYNNNSHLGRYGHQISKKLNDGQKLDKNEKDNIHSYTVNSTSLNKHLIKTKGKPTNKQHADHTNTLSASIQKNKIKHINYMQLK